MNKEVKTIRKVAELVEGEIRRDYSGRAMYGATCYGIVTGDPDQAERLARRCGLHGARFDSMGLQSIIYWPAVPGNTEPVCVTCELPGDECGCKPRGTFELNR